MAPPFPSKTISGLETGDDTGAPYVNLIVPAFDKHARQPGMSGLTSYQVDWPGRSFGSMSRQARLRL